MKKESKPEFRQSGASKVVNVDKAGESKVLKIFEKKMAEQRRGGLEKEFSPEMVSIFKQINEFMPDFIRNYGGAPVSLSPENIKVTNIAGKPDLDLKLKTPDDSAVSQAGIYNSASQELRLFIRTTGNMREDRAVVASIAVHEIIHFNSFQSLTAIAQERLAESNPGWNETDYPHFFISKKGKKIFFFKRRGGLQIVSIDATKIFFNTIDEAVTEELNKRFCRLYFPKVFELKNNLANLKKYIDRNIKPERRDFYYEEASGIIDTVNPETGKHKWNLSLFGYKGERDYLNKLIDDIFEANQERFASREDVFKIFAKAAMSGKLLELAELIEGTFGKGSFRKIGEQTQKTISSKKNL